MKYISTRGKSIAANYSEAMREGLAPDGGLYIPQEFPVFKLETFKKAETLVESAQIILKPFFEGDSLDGRLKQICEESFNFPLVLKNLAHSTSVLELFHGPTCAFKDFGARFLASCFEGTNQTILVATSGDTGGAVAAAFFKKSDVRVVVLFPRDGVSPTQEKQLTCWGENILSLRVNGSFDDCQKLVKSAMTRPEAKKKFNFTSANSISIGRLLPQVTYYAASSIWYLKEHKEAPAFSIPTGNLGNALAAFWAKKMGFPIRHIGLATNANDAIPRYYEKGIMEFRPSMKTLANAMDVGNPSNWERLAGTGDDFISFSNSLSVTDENIQKTIREGPKTWGEIWCPHTATAVFLREKQMDNDWIVVATAHPAKFREIVEPLIGKSVPLPRSLANLLNKSQHVIDIEPRIEDLLSSL